jgi:hypothetical protein
MSYSQLVIQSQEPQAGETQVRVSCQASGRMLFDGRVIAGGRLLVEIDPETAGAKLVAVLPPAGYGRINLT